MTLDFLGDLKRTHMCGELRASDAGSRVVLMGWVNRRRDLGSLIFIDLRDKTGISQIVFDPQISNASQNLNAQSAQGTAAAAHEKAESLRSEYVVAVIGEVKLRTPNTVNKNLPTGEVEVVAQELRILNESKPLPFSPADENAGAVNEEVRLKYRYLDLRRPAMHENIALRHRVALAIRKELDARGFYEIETPFMTRSTPEGARDYLVPSRVYPGQFYALPQSPQLFKQILMISGMDKYFQIVRCFRDEDLRADRQPEFTQIDLEMTYPQQETVFEVVEGFLRAAFKAAGHELKTPFPRMTYDEAIRQYGIDKPDLRLPAMTDVREAFTEEDLNVLTLAIGLPVVAVRIPKVGELSRKERDEIKPLFNSKHAKLIDDFKRLEKSFPEAVTKIRELVRQKSGAPAVDSDAGDLLVLVAGAASSNDQHNVSGNESGSHKGTGVPSNESDSQTGLGNESGSYKGAGLQSGENSSNKSGALAPATRRVYEAAGQLRLELARKYASRHKAFEKSGDTARDFRWTWVTDFPMFEWDEEGKRWQAAHHPFTSPHEKDMENVLTQRDLGEVRALAYDVVLNGTELGSGSIRIHRQDVQSQIFRAMGMTEEKARSRFGFFLEALEFGTPPHGGIALGLDRIVMILAGAESLREVIPFPKTAKAVDMMVDAPTPVSEQQLKELGIRARKRE